MYVVEKLGIRENSEFSRENWEFRILARKSGNVARGRQQPLRNTGVLKNHHVTRRRRDFAPKKQPCDANKRNAFILMRQQFENRRRSKFSVIRNRENMTGRPSSYVLCAPRH